MTFEVFSCRGDQFQAWPSRGLVATLFGMKTPATSPDTTRHRLLEGVLLRLALSLRKSSALFDPLSGLSRVKEA